ncbi:hypothetical protein QFC21_006271 [Naganishia friedmannii]|uniref:Uncharacterized protein n=1 Tax=Naganishia friedmannii TaxID=89922 RepID=A0ACC2V465_9TREE|nr:hypothetical protein QFC21_006271 [Naganishia friedmannii]
MARALESGPIPLASTSSNIAYDSDPAPRKESQHTLPPAPSSDEQPNVKVSGEKRKKPEVGRRSGIMSVKSQVARMEQGETSDELAGNSETISDAEREVKKSRRFMSPSEALLDSAQAKVPAPGLQRYSQSRIHSTATTSGSAINARRQTTFTLRPPLESSSDAVEGTPSGNPRNRNGPSLSPDANSQIAPGAALINRYVNGRRHRASQSPGATSSTAHFHSFSAIVTTGGAGSGMDTTVEEDDSGDSGEISGASGDTTRQNQTTSISISGLHDESSYEAMEREVQAGRVSGARTTANASSAGPRFQTPRQALFHQPRASASRQESETPNTARQAFFPIPESEMESYAPGSAEANPNKRRAARRSVDNQAYRPEGTASVPQRERPMTDSADEDGGGEGLAAHLPERSTRGKRHEQGEGYLGTGLSFDPHTPGKSRSKKGERGRRESAEAEDRKHGNQSAVDSPDKVVGASNGARNPSRTKGAKFTAPARSRKSASVGFSPVKERPTATANNNVEQANCDQTMDGNTIREKQREIMTIPHHYLSLLREKAWVTPVKWLGILGGLAAVLCWLVTHAPPEVLSQAGHQRPSSGTGNTFRGWSRHVPQQTGRTGMVGEFDEGIHGSMADLLDRLGHLEHTLALLSTETETFKDEQARSQHELANAHTLVGQLDEDLRREKSKREQDRRDLDQIRTTIHAFRQEVETSSSSLSSSVEELNRKVDILETGVKEALSEQRMMRILERVLPSGVPVRRDSKTGEITIDPSFWTEMRKVVATKSDLESLSHKVASIKKKQEAEGVNAAQPTASVVTKVPTWQDFLDDNEDALRTWAEKTFDRKLVEAEVIDRFSFISMLKDELYAMQTTLQNEASSREESIKTKIDKELGHIRRTSRTAEPISNPVIAAGDMDTDIRPVLQRLIDESLLKYSKDMLAKPDYALASGGAHTVDIQTSKTLVLVRPQITWSSWLTRSRNAARLEVTGRTPLVILHPATQPGMCWPFQGAQGHVGIALSRTIHVTDVTVEHVARELVSAKSLMSAPRDMELWAAYDEDRAEEVKDFLNRYPEYQGDSQPPLVEGRMVLLSRFQYTPYTSQPIQSFPVHGDIQALNLSTDNVMLKVTSNWGDDYTCLYRVRVHGQAEEDLGVNES